MRLGMWCGFELEDHVVIDKRYFRPTEVDNLTLRETEAEVRKFLVGSHDQLGSFQFLLQIRNNGV